MRKLTAEFDRDLAQLKHGRVLRPTAEDRAALEQVPHWAKPIVAAAFKWHARRQTPSHKNPLSPR